MPVVYIVGSDYLIQQMFEDEGWDIAEELDKDYIDLVQFTGGSDVSPDFYGELAIQECGDSDRKRDLFELGIFTWCVAKEVPMAGICRGGQFLNVLNGGSLWQHVDNHSISGTHEIDDLCFNRKLQVTSTHHQMMRVSRIREDALILATAARSTIRKGDASVENFHKTDDIEVVYYDKTSSLCFQPHPEYVNEGDPCREYYFQLISEFLYLSTKKREGVVND